MIERGVRPSRIFPRRKRRNECDRQRDRHGFLPSIACDERDAAGQEHVGPDDPDENLRGGRANAAERKRAGQSENLSVIKRRPALRVSAACGSLLASPQRSSKGRSFTRGKRRGARSAEVHRGVHAARRSGIVRPSGPRHPQPHRTRRRRRRDLARGAPAIIRPRQAGAARCRALSRLHQLPAAVRRAGPGLSCTRLQRLRPAHPAPPASRIA